MRHRLVVSSVFLLFALTLSTLPAQGQPPPAGTASVSIMDNGNCSVTVTYTWSGFKGSDLTAHFGVQWPGVGGTTWLIAEAVSPVTGSGTVSHTVDLTGYGSHVYSGWGHLLNTKGREPSGSMAISATGTSLSC